MDLHLQNLLKEYEKKQPLYEDFSLAVNKMLYSLLEQKNYKHHIYYRVKSLERLKEKVIRKKKLKKVYRRLHDIEDLAGVRIVFYLESEKEKFISLLEREIPEMICNIEELEKKSGYKAKHVILAFDKKRLRLAEYKKFKNLKCEVQMVSIFNHAWAELEHDWLYKDMRKFKLKNPEKYITLKKQMEKIFKNYVRKLTSRFEKIAKQLPGEKK